MSDERYRVQRAFRALSRFADKLERSWRARELSWREVREGIFGVCELVADEHGVDVRAKTTTEKGAGYVVLIEARGSNLRLSVRRSLDRLYEMPDDPEADRNRSRFSPTPAAFNCDPT